MRKLLLLLLPFLAACATPGPTPEAVRDLAPTGKLRAAINYGNIVLAQKGPAGEARGVSVDLANELGRRLGVPVELLSYDAAGKVADAAASNAWDVAFVAIDPGRGKTIAYSAPYVLIEGTYLVRNDSPLRRVEEFDRPGMRIAVGAKSAYDLYLSRALKQATLVRSPTSPEAIPLFINQRLDAVAGVKQPLVIYAKNNPGYRVIDGRFMAIEQAMGTPQGRSGAGVRYLAQFVEEMKSSGFVAASLQRSGQRDAMVAPAASPSADWIREGASY
jgi:polar amino acid transport system substrate-binding protein